MVHINMMNCMLVGHPVDGIEWETMQFNMHMVELIDLRINHNRGNQGCNMKGVASQHGIGGNDDNKQSDTHERFKRVQQ